MRSDGASSPALPDCRAAIPTVAVMASSRTATEDVRRSCEAPTNFSRLRVWVTLRRRAWSPTVNRFSVARRSSELTLLAAEPDPPTHDVKRQDNQCKSENNDSERKRGDIHISLIGATLSDFRQTRPNGSV